MYPTGDIAMSRCSINAGRFGISKCCRNHFEVWILSNGLLYHLAKIGWVEFRYMLIHARNLEAETCGKIFFVPHHHIYVRSDGMINFLGLCLAPN